MSATLSAFSFVLNDTTGVRRERKVFFETHQQGRARRMGMGS